MRKPGPGKSRKNPLPTGNMDFDNSLKRVYDDINELVNSVNGGLHLGNADEM